MTADELIDSYVADVARLLPRKQRRDVAMELRTLLHDEVDAKAAAAGSASREESARDLLAGFGRPAEIAARYGSPVTLIDPADTRTFITFSVAGGALILFGGLLRFLIEPAATGRDPGAVVGEWWPQVFWWPGFLVVCFAVAAWVRRRWPQRAAWKPRPVATDRVGRPGLAASLAFFAVGTFALVNPAWFIEKLSNGRATPEAYHAFAYEEDFLRLRGPVLLGLIGLGLVLQFTLLVQGRWRPLTRKADLVLNVFICAGLTWAVAGGPIFQAEPTDQAMRGAIALIILITLVSTGLRAARSHSWRDSLA